MGQVPRISEKGEVVFMGHLVSGGTPLGDGIFLWKPTAPANPTMSVTLALVRTAGSLMPFNNPLRQRPRSLIYRR
jgi:hypothetical protein